MDVAARFDEGYSPETIALDLYPTLDLPIIYKAIAFYLEHEPEVKAIIAQNAREIEKQAAQPRTTPTAAELRRRMNAKRRAAASGRDATAASE